jgi:hypothetical protein
MSSEAANGPTWSEKLDARDLVLITEGLPYVLIQALKGPDGDDDLRLRAGLGAEETLGVLPLMALSELPEEHNPLLTLLRQVYDVQCSTAEAREVVRSIAREVGLELGGARDAEV